MKGWFSKQTVVGLYREYWYEPAIGAMQCGYIDDRNRDGIEGRFADLPFPYCPSPVVSNAVDLPQCNTQVRTDGSIRTMEDYVLPPSKAPPGRTVYLWADDRPCVTGTALSFGTQSVASPTWTVGREIPELVLPEAAGGEGQLTYHLAPALPPGVTRNGFVISGTPTRVFNGGGYVWLAKDKDGDSAAISFRLAVRWPQPRVDALAGLLPYRARMTRM